MVCRVCTGQNDQTVVYVENTEYTVVANLEGAGRPSSKGAPREPRHPPG